MLALLLSALQQVGTSLELWLGGSLYGSQECLGGPGWPVPALKSNWPPQIRYVVDVVRQNKKQENVVNQW